MKRLLLLLLTVLTITSCNKDNKDPEPAQTPSELISLNRWKLDKYTDQNGKIIPDGSLNTQALFLYAMNFEFRADGEVRGIDKVTGNIIDKGVWDFLSNATSLNIKLTGLDYDFKIINLKTGKLTLQAPVGNFLTGVGERINLDFTAVSN